MGLIDALLPTSMCCLLKTSYYIMAGASVLLS